MKNRINVINSEREEAMAFKGHGFEVMGISLFGPQPLDLVHLNLDDKLTVSLNGSGTGGARATIAQTGR
jgi:hypothetical protein